MTTEIDFEAIVQGIAQVVIVVDEDLRIVWANRQAEQVAGGDPVGRHCYAVYQGRQTPCQGCHTLKTFASGQSIPNTSTVTDETGGKRFFDGFTLVVQRDGQGRPLLVAEVAGELG